MRRSVLLVGLLAGLALAPPVQAAAPWSVPQDLARPHTFVDAVRLTFSGRGTALSTWGWQDGVGTSGLGGVDTAARPAGAAAFGPERALAGARTQAQRQTVVAGPVAYASTRTIVATWRPEDAMQRRFRVAAAFGDDTGHVGSARTLAVQDGARVPLIAADAAGDAAIAWWQDRGVTNDRVWVSLRRPGGSFAAPVLLATGRVRSVAVAVSPRGDVLVAWDARGTIRTRTRRAGARSFGATQTIRSAPAYDATLRTALTARGRAYVGWTAQLLTEGGGPGPFTAEVAVRPVGATTFRPAQLLEERAAGARQAGVDLAVDGEAATFAWSGLFAGLQRVRVASTDAAAVFGDVQDLSTAGVRSTDPSVAADRGRRLVTWVEAVPPAGDGGEGTVVASLATAGQAFGAAETVSALPSARIPDAGFAPDGGAPTIVWSARASGAGRVAQIRTSAQASTRTG